MNLMQLSARTPTTAYRTAATDNSSKSSGSQTGAESDLAAVSGNDALANKQVFLQLLVTQIKNQDPLNPQDGVQFVSQLAQFTELEQSLGMRQDVGSIKDFLLQTAAAAPADTSTDTQS